MLPEDQSVAKDIAAIGRISAVPSLLRVVCDTTGMGFAAVARVSDLSWTACAVQDNIGFGLKPGGQLELHTTLCHESRLAREPVVIDNVSEDPNFRDHHTPRIYGLQSYISVPIVRSSGEYFGNLCAIDPQPKRVSDARTVSMFQLFAELIALQLDSEDRHQVTEAALLDARATAELREHFIAVLGHDLRSPLAAVGASATFLTRRSQDADGVKVGQRLHAIVHRMAGLIDDVMDFARGRLGNGLGVEIRQVDDVAAALQHIVDEMRHAHPERVVIDDIDVREPVVCDRGRVQQLLSNLLGNALAHGAVDEPVVVKAAIEGGWLTMCVANAGEPIAPANLPKVFAPYWRPPNSKPGGGLGLGLYICSQIVKAHGGTIEVSSTADAGTRFTAKLPSRAPA